MATPPSFQRRPGRIIDTRGQSAAVNHTISADRAGGHAAHAELGLAQLTPSSSIQGNHDLLKYQEELLLLEQENRKRLLQARQEQASQVCGQGVAVNNFLVITI